MTDRDLDARIAVSHNIARHVENTHRLAALSALPRPDDMRRLMTLHRAVGDLDEALGVGHGDIDAELELVAATAQAWLEHRMAAQARCTCPLQPGVPSEDRLVDPFCVAHGEGL